MVQSASRILQGHLKALALDRNTVGAFSKHVQGRRNVYRMEDAILALNGLEQESVLLPEQIEPGIGGHRSARATAINAAHSPIKHGLNILLWEQAIREGGLTSEEKRRVRGMYLAHARYSLIPSSERLQDNLAKSKRLERDFNQATLGVADLERFEHVRDTAKKVLDKVTAALMERRETPHREVMNSSLISFNGLLAHLNDVCENKDQLRQVMMPDAKP